MTCQEIGEYVTQQEKRDKDQGLFISTAGYRTAQMLILSNSLCVKKPRIAKFDELFPEFDIENNNSKEEAIENRWREFLGVVR